MSEKDLLTELLSMDKDALLAYIQQECANRGIEYKIDFDSINIESLFDFVAEKLHPEYEVWMHSKYAL
ncbi:MAG: hypothetical protein WAZ96_01155 [Candidatus Moraniibacteriota bacterium]